MFRIKPFFLVPKKKPLMLQKILFVKTAKKISMISKQQHSQENLNDQ